MIFHIDSNETGMLLDKIKGFKFNWNLSDYSLAWILFFSIVYQKLAPIGFVFWIITAYKTWEIRSFDNFLKSTLEGNKKWFIAYYLLLVIGMFWTDNIPFGLSKLENKLTFVLFPILFSATTLRSNQKHWKLILISALTFSLLTNEFMAFIKTLNSSESFSWQYFYDSRFCLNMHRSYFASYLTIGIIFLLDFQQKKMSLILTILILFLGIGVFQTMSKMGIISLAIVLTIYTLVVLMRKSWKTGLSLILIMFTLFFFSITYKESPLRTRFEAISSALSNLKTENNPSTESNAARIIMWNTSLQVIGQYWLIGTGTGDYNEILTNLNKKLNNTGVTEEQLNSHNQFLNTWVQLGIFGLFVLVMLFVSSFFQNGRNLFGILILSTFLINFLVESFLETQSGIILFCILSVILFRESKEQQVQSTENS